MKKVVDNIGVEARLRKVFAAHFHPERGSRYWLDRAGNLGFDPCTDIRSVADLHRFGMTDPKELAKYRVEDFLPRSLLGRKSELTIAQTGGTLGQPAWTAYQEHEFREAFVDPFVAAANYLNFPSSGNWLYVGPSGPHIIGRAADAIARATGAMMPFSVDFDPRWARKLASGSFASERHMQHIVDQSLAVLETEAITVLFSTPVVVRALADRMTKEQRKRVRGVHYGGMAIETSELADLQEQVFPDAVHLSGYGNTLFGCCLEINVAVDRELIYYPYGDRILFGVLDQEGDRTDCVVYGEAGAEGSLVFSRLDETVLLINVAERDWVRLREPPANAPEGFGLMGVASPTPGIEQRNVCSVSLY